MLFFLSFCSHGEHEHQPDLIGVLLCLHLAEVATAGHGSAVPGPSGSAAPPPPRCCPTCSPQCPLPLLGLDPATTAVQYFPSESALLSGFVSLVQRVDPDVLMGWEMQKSALGYLVERAQYLSRRPALLEELSRCLPPPPVDGPHGQGARRPGAGAQQEQNFHGAERDKSNPA